VNKSTQLSNLVWLLSSWQHPCRPFFASDATWIRPVESAIRS